MAERIMRVVKEQLGCVETVHREEFVMRLVTGKSGRESVRLLKKIMIIKNNKIKKS